MFYVADGLQQNENQIWACLKQVWVPLTTMSILLLFFIQKIYDHLSLRVHAQNHLLILLNLSQKIELIKT